MGNLHMVELLCFHTAGVNAEQGFKGTTEEREDAELTKLQDEAERL